MDPLDRDLLQKIAKQTEDNSRLLKQIRSHMRWARILSILYWLVIIGIGAGAYYYIQPYLTSLLGIYTNTSENYGEFSDQINNIGGYFRR